MEFASTHNKHVKDEQALPSPASLMRFLPLHDAQIKLIEESRNAIASIVHGNSKRILIIVGPCSIHDPNSAMEYARWLNTQRNKHSANLEIVMRTYFEKPRTTVGWKGLINDPHLDNGFQINEGLRIARSLLLDINKLGLPTATEFLDTNSPQYIADLISWGAIGARTTESQIHRELASGLSMPIGFKNGTDGSIQIAIDAIKTAQYPHHFIGMNEEGVGSIIATNGNPDTHIILRGSGKGTNYDHNSVVSTIQKLQEAGLDQRIMIDASHGNSQKDPERQMIVINSVCDQIREGTQSIMGVMIESNIKAGKQSYTPGVDNPNKLTYGKSITDGCVDLKTTEDMLNALSDAQKNIQQ